MPISPTPWTRDEYGTIRDAAGERVGLANVSLSMGRVKPDDTCHGNTALLLAAPALLEFWRAYKALEKAVEDAKDDAHCRFYMADRAAGDAVRALEE